MTTQFHIHIRLFDFFAGGKGEHGDSGRPGQSGPIGTRGRTGSRGSKGGSGKPGPQGFKGYPGKIYFDFFMIFILCRASTNVERYRQYLNFYPSIFLR